MIARNTMSMILSPSAEKAARWLNLIRISANTGNTINRRIEIKYTFLFVKICFRSIPAKSIPVTIMLAGPIILPTELIESFMISGKWIFVKKSRIPIKIEIIFILRTIFFQS